MRSENSIKNIKVNLVSQLLGDVLSFVCRTVFIRMLGATYLGVSNLFIGILSLLSLAELGIGTAIGFSMYKPLAGNDRRKIGALMNLYRRAYHVIGLIVAAAGLLLTPFIPFFSGSPDIPYLTPIYLLYVFNSAITYFFSYKQSIINADQKNYICTIYQYGLCIAQNIIQIVILLQTKNFILYLCTQILFSFLTNFLLSRKADRMYPYLKHYRNAKLARADRNAIFKNIRAMFMNRIGGAIVSGTDNILISKFVGLVSVGIYANYFMVTNTINNLTSQIFSGVTASVGNLGAVENDRKSYEVYLSVNFAGFWIFGFCAVCLFCLFNPFIRLWMLYTGKGDELLFPMTVVFLIVLNFYATGMRQATIMFKNAFGLFWYDRYRSLVEAAVNLGMSIFLARQIGVAGVFLGTLISTIAIDFWVEPLVLFRHGFHRRPVPYFLRYLFYTAFIFAVGFFTWYLCSLAGGYSFGSFVLKCVICLIIPNLLLFLAFCRTKEFQYLKRYVRLPAFLKRK